MLRSSFARRALALAMVAQAGAVALVSAPAQAAATTVFMPVADAAVYSGSPAVNFGSANRLEADDSPKTRSFLRFEVAGLTTAPTGARLRLWVTNGSSNGPEVRAVTAAWDESTVTYNTRPSVSTTKIDDVGSVPAGRWLEYDVSAMVAGNGTVEIGLVGDSSDGTDFASREHATVPHRPQLVVEAGATTEPPPPPPPPPPGAFSFGLVGDTGYSSSSVSKFLAVRNSMNAATLDFSVHIGDIKNGDDPCLNSIYTTNRDRFNGFDHPLAYTPGDNEWRDCTNKVERLAYLRSVFFPTNQTQGTPSMTVARQSAAFPENAVWHDGPVTFVTVHTVGSDNNAGSSEFAPRNAANIAWIKAAFDAALARNSAGVVILTHANPGFPPDATGRSTRTGFKSYLETLLAEVKAWGRPVLYVHGDTHIFRVDKPKILGVQPPNFTRVEVYGPSDEHWVRVDVNPSDPDGLFHVYSR